MNLIPTKCLVIALTLTCANVHAKGIAAVKAQSYHDDAKASVFMFESVSATSAIITFQIKGQKPYSIIKSDKVVYVEVIDRIGDITKDSDIEPYRKSLKECEVFTSKYTKSKPLLTPYIEMISGVVEKYDRGMAKKNGEWVEKYLLASANTTRVDASVRWKMLTLENGNSYDNVFLKNHDPSGITISHSTGGRKIPYEELPADIQDELGGFDPQAAEAFREDERQAQLKAQKLASRRAAASKRKGWRQLPLSERYSITNNDKKYRNASFRYEDFFHLEKEVKHAVASQMLTKDDEEKKISLLPKGGRLIVTVYARSIGAANSKYFTVIIHDSSGREIARVKGSDSTANVPSRHDRRWWNLMLINLDEDIADGIKIRVANTLSNGFYDFEITPNL